MMRGKGKQDGWYIACNPTELICKVSAVITPHHFLLQYTSLSQFLLYSTRTGKKIDERQMRRSLQARL